MQLGNVVSHRVVLFLFRAENNVGVLDAQHRLVGRNDDDFELVDLLEFGGLGLGRTGHAAEFFVEPEVVLEGDRRQGLIFLANLHAFLGFDGLMQSVGPAATRHQAAGKGVDDDHLAILHDIINVALVDGVGLDARFDIVLQIPVFSVGNVVDAEQLFDRLPAGVGHADGALLFVDEVIA